MADNLKMVGDFKYADNSSFQDLVITNEGHRLLLITILGKAGEYNSLTIEDTKIYSEPSDQENLIKTMILSFTVEEMEKIGNSFLERAKQIREARKNSI